MTYKAMVEFANSKTQIEMLGYLADGMSPQEVAIKTGRNDSSIYRSIRAVKKRITLAGFGEHFTTEKQLPVGLSVKGTSTLTNSEGEAVMQWVKTDRTMEDRIQLMQEAIQDIVSDVGGYAKPTPCRDFHDDEHMTVYNIGDAHIGMLAHRDESGEDFDLKIAEEDLIKTMTMLVDSAPHSETALVVDVGDFFHADNQENQTSHSKNKLDVDGRWFKVLRVGLNIMTQLVREALIKHKHVIVKNAIGNHNEHSAIFLSLYLASWFRDEPRVTVEESPAIFWYMKYGRNLIGVTHGHTAKAEKLGGIMSVDQKENWSETDNRYWYTGHIHHQSVKEFENCVVETFRTLAGKDAWHTGAGYRSGRDMKCIVLHKEFGEIQRHTVNLAMIRANVAVGGE